ncbi:hypothetical protein RJT34_27628 [Clitoria ternatea]|uniref:Uncharacterized protein n=1 Tax=Clitoria ternatea TaxID=43366 RepID=A0AAN9FGR3_CLITE
MDNPSGNFKKKFRHISKGSWTFSDRDDGWQTSDSTAHALKCCMLLSMFPSDMVGEKMEAEKLFDPVNLLLSLQSKNGGFTGWEPARAYKWLEILNPTEFFEDIVVEHEYVECTGSIGREKSRIRLREQLNSLRTHKQRMVLGMVTGEFVSFLVPVLLF